MLLFLLVLPVAIAVIGFVVSKHISWKEFLLQLGIQLAVIVAGYYIAIAARTADTELWNAQIDKKWEKHQTCCHPYCCRWGTCSSGSGKNRRTYTCCKAWCKLHSYDMDWGAGNNIGETVYSNTCNSPSTPQPSRWQQIKIGDPTATEHSYTNYIKGNPDSILRRRGIEERFPGLMPDYPETYDYYRANRVITAGVSIPNLRELNEKLSLVNGHLGPKRQVNIIVVVTKSGDEMYLEGLREHWLGGKKNDFVLVVGAPKFPEIAWAGVLSWTPSEDLKVDVRNAVLDLKVFDSRVLEVLENEVGARFRRRSMEDFKYLAGTLEPSTGAEVFLFLLGIALSIGLKIVMIKHDVFGDERNYGGWT